MSFLHKIMLKGNWRPLMDKMPGWQEIKPEIWSGSGAILESNAPNNKALLSSYIGDGNINLLDDKGLELTNEASHSELLNIDRKIPSLIHIALNIPKNSSSLVKSILPDLAPVLERSARFDPLAQKLVEAEHFILSDGTYVTERYLDEQIDEIVDHIGFCCENLEQVLEVYEVIQQVGLEILIKPQWLDGSFLFHFLGPDNNVHDFFYASDELIANASKTD